MFKFLLIAPYQGLKDLAENVASNLPYELDVKVGDLQQGLILAQASELQKYDAVISRGGTANLIRQHLNIPVVEIPVNGYDILRALTFLKGYRGKVGIIGFPNVVDGVDTIAELLDMRVKKFTIHHESEAGEAVKKAREQGVNLVIGDVITVSTAESHGLKAVLITSGREAVLEALERAKELAIQQREKRREATFSKQVLDELKSGIMVVDEEGRIRVCNRAASELFGVSAGQAENMAWREFAGRVGLSLPVEAGASFTHAFADPERPLGGWVVCGSPMNNGWTIYQFHKREDVIAWHRMIKRAQLNAAPPPTHFQHFVATEYLKAAYLDNAQKWSELSDPIAILGETGTGKRSLAEAIHNRSPNREGPFVCFQAAVAPPEKQMEMLFGYGREAEEAERTAMVWQADGGTLYIENVDSLQKQAQKRLAEMLEHPEDAGCRIGAPSFRLIVSSTEDLARKAKEGEFEQKLFTLLQPRLLRLPPLRDFLDDLDQLIFWFLAELNRSLGKQVMGVKPDVLRMFKTYHWPGNIAELKRVLKTLVERSEGSFVTMKEAEAVLASHVADAPPSSSLKAFIGTNRSLKEMEHDIIRIVLEQENYNQSTAAKRLGINRTTLWRKLNRKE